jgi:hypothetical protein
VEDLDAFYRRFTSTQFKSETVAKWKARLTARVLHGLCPTVRVGEFEELLLGALARQREGQNEKAIQRLFLDRFDDPRILGYTFGYTTWLIDFFSDKGNLKQLPPKAAERIWRDAQPWVKERLPRFQTFLDRRWREAMSRRTLADKPDFVRQFHLSLEKASQKCLGRSGEPGTFWVYTLMLAGWFEVAEFRSVRSLYQWLRRFLPESQIGTLEALQKNCGPSRLGLQFRHPG